MNQARIYQPAPNAMQTGPFGKSGWILEFEPGARKEIDPLMGWVSSSDTQAQVRIKFHDKEQALAFANKNGIDFTLQEPSPRRFRIKNYADNFSFRRA